MEPQNPWYSTVSMSRTIVPFLGGSRRQAPFPLTIALHRVPREGHGAAEVQVPETKVPFQQRIVWTAVTLVIFLVMSQMPLYGIVSSGQPAPLEIKGGSSIHINN